MAGDFESDLLSKMENLQLLELGYAFMNLNLSYLNSLVHLEHLHTWVGIQEILGLETALRNGLVNLKRLTVLSIHSVYDEMNAEELERSTSNQTNVEGGLDSKWGVPVPIKWMNDVQSLTDPFRELRNICRTRKIILTVQKYRDATV